MAWGVCSTECRTECETEKRLETCILIKVPDKIEVFERKMLRKTYMGQLMIKDNGE
jgi:hypothetical protein